MDVCVALGVPGRRCTLSASSGGGGGSWKQSLKRRASAQCVQHIQPEVSTGQLELPTAQITSRTSSRISFLSPQNPHRNRQLCHDSKRLTCIAVRTLRGFLNKKLCFRLPNNIQHLTSNSRIFSQTLLLLFFNILQRTSVWARLDFVILDTNFPPLPASAPEWTVAAPRCVGGGTTPTANVQPSLWGQELTIMLSQAFLFQPPKNVPNLLVTCNHDCQFRWASLQTHTQRHTHSLSVSLIGYCTASFIGSYTVTH